MAQPATATTAAAAPAHQVVHLTCKELHLEIPPTTEPVFTLVAAPPLTCEAAAIATSSAVSVHRPKELIAQQQRAPLGTRNIGTVQISTQSGEPSQHNTSEGKASGNVTYAVPLYQARVAYRRPNTYKERVSLCIVDDAAGHHRHNKHISNNNSNSTRRSLRGVVNAVTTEERQPEVQRVCFVDLASLTPVSRVLLRCPRTGELLAPTPLFCRYDANAAHSTGAASSSTNGAVERKEGEAGAADAKGLKTAAHVHAQYHRRRVVILPHNAAGQTYELVCVVTKRARDEAGAAQDD